MVSLRSRNILEVQLYNNWRKKANCAEVIIIQYNTIQYNTIQYNTVMSMVLIILNSLQSAFWEPSASWNSSKVRYIKNNWTYMGVIY
jgi:hypothetical protein